MEIHTKIRYLIICGYQFFPYKIMIATNYEVSYFSKFDRISAYSFQNKSIATTRWVARPKPRTTKSYKGRVGLQIGFCNNSLRYPLFAICSNCLKTTEASDNNTTAQKLIPLKYRVDYWSRKRREAAVQQRDSSHLKKGHNTSSSWSVIGPYCTLCRILPFWVQSAKIFCLTFSVYLVTSHNILVTSMYYFCRILC